MLVFIEAPTPFCFRRSWFIGALIFMEEKLGAVLVRKGGTESRLQGVS